MSEKEQEEKKGRSENKMAQNAGANSAIVSTHKSIDKTAKKFNKPEEYSQGLRNRSLDDRNAKKKSIDDAFKNGSVKDPYTGEKLTKTQKEAKALYGDDWAKHAAEADHVDPLANIYARHKDNPFLSLSDIKKRANSKENLQPVSKSNNTSKGDKTNEEFIKTTKNKISKSAKEKQINKGKTQQANNDKGFMVDTAKNVGNTFLASGTQSAGVSAIATGVLSMASNINAVRKGEKSGKDAVIDSVTDTAKSAGNSFVQSGSTTVLTQAAPAMPKLIMKNMEKSKSKFLRKLSKSKILQKFTKSSSKALKNAAKVAPEAITALTTFGPDVYKAAKNEISGQQLAKNSVENAAGWVAATAASVLVPGSAPFVLTASIIAGAGATAIAKKGADQIIDDDSKIMIEEKNKRIEELANVYNLTQEEKENVINKINNIVDEEWLTEMYKYAGRDSKYLQDKYIDKELLQFFEDAYFEKKFVPFWIRLKVLFTTQKIKKNIGMKVIPFKQIFIAIGIVLVGILLCFLPHSCQSCSIQSRKNDIQEQENTLNDNLFPQQKSPYFLRDSSEFEDNQKAQEWFDEKTIEIKKCLLKNSDIYFEIKGYIARFDNDVDGTFLSNERAKVVKTGFVERGIPENALKVIEANDTNVNEYTNHLSETDRHENRVVIIYPIKK